MIRSERPLMGDEIVACGFNYIENNQDFKSCSEDYRQQMKDFLNVTKNAVDKIYSKYHINKNSPEGKI